MKFLGLVLILLLSTCLVLQISSFKIKDVRREANMYDVDKLYFWHNGFYYYVLHTEDDVKLFGWLENDSNPKEIFSAKGYFMPGGNLTFSLSPDGNFLLYIKSDTSVSAIFSFFMSKFIKQYFLSAGEPTIWSPDSDGYYYYWSSQSSKSIRWQAIGTKADFSPASVSLEENSENIKSAREIYISEDSSRLHVIGNKWIYGQLEGVDPNDELHLDTISEESDWAFVLDDGINYYGIKASSYDGAELVAIDQKTRQEKVIVAKSDGSRLINAQKFTLADEQYFLVLRGEKDQDHLELHKYGGGLVKKFNLPAGRIRLFQNSSKAPKIYLRLVQNSGESVFYEYDKATGLTGEFEVQKNHHSVQ